MCLVFEDREGVVWQRSNSLVDYFGFDAEDGDMVLTARTAAGPALKVSGVARSQPRGETVNALYELLICVHGVEILSVNAPEPEDSVSSVSFSLFRCFF